MTDVRHPFGGGLADWTFTDGAGHAATLAGGATVTFYNQQSGGTQITDLSTDLAGLSAITSVTSSDGTDGLLYGTVPVFYGPLDITSMWADGGNGFRALIQSTDAGAMAQAALVEADGINAAVAAHTADHNGHGTGLGDLVDVNIPPIISRTDGYVLTWDVALGAAVLLPPSVASGALLLNPPLAGGLYVGNVAVPPLASQGPSGTPWLTLQQPSSPSDNNPDAIQLFGTNPTSGNKVKTAWNNGNNEHRRAPSTSGRIGGRDFESYEVNGFSTGRFYEASTNPTNSANREPLLGVYGSASSTKPGWVEGTRVVSALQGLAGGGNFNSLARTIYRGQSATAGAPTSGTWTAGDWIHDVNGSVVICTASGTPGTWSLGASAWTNVPSQATGAAQGTPPLQYRMEGDRVYLRGGLTYSGAVTVLGVIPAAFRPAIDEIFSNRVRTSVAAGNDILVAHATGNITTSSAGSNGQTQAFGGISWSITA